MNFHPSHSNAFARFIAFAPDTGKSSGSDAPPPKDDSKETPPSDAQDDSEESKGGPKGGKSPQTQKKTTFTPEQQTEVDRIVAERLDRERNRAAQTAAEERERLELDSLREQQRFQELAQKETLRAEKLKSDLETLTAERDALAANLERFTAALTSQLETERKNLPSHLIQLLDKLDPVDQLEYLASNRDALSEKPKKKGPPETPPPSSTKELTDQERDAAARDAAAFYRRAF